MNKIMRNKFLLQYIILALLLSGLIANTNINATVLLKTANNLEKINQIDEALNIYIKLFENDKSNQAYFKKIKKILLEKKSYEKLIIIYEEHISNVEELEDNFLIEIELLEIKIWNQSNDWETYLNHILELYVMNPKNYNYINKKNNIKYINQKLRINKKNEEAYEVIKNVRNYFKFSIDLLKYSKDKILNWELPIFKNVNNTNLRLNHLSYKDTAFLSKELVSIFSQNKQYKNSIEEAILFLKTNHNDKRYPYNALKKEIFISIDKILENTTIYDFNFPITNKQFNANTFLNYQILKKYKEEDVEYIINVYNTLIKNNFAINESKLKLANINYKILKDLDYAYKLYTELEIKNIKINFEASINRIDILITKGYLDSASVLVKNKLEEIEKLGFIYEKNNILNNLNYKNIQILFYKGDYLKMKESLDVLIDANQLQNQYLNDLLEIKNISLFFNEDQKSFKKYSSIQHKIKMNKDFESALELIQLINSENILISELAQFQYALIQIKKGNIQEAQTIISSMPHKTIFSEIALIINAEIEDYLNNNYQISIKLYEELINKYPNSIYKENIIKRLNIIHNLIKDKIDS